MSHPHEPASEAPGSAFAENGSVNPASGSDSASDTLNASFVGDAAHGSDYVRMRVSDLVQQSSNRSEFLKALASELATHFRTGIVAVQSADWNRPIMLVLDDDLGQRIQRPSILDLLESATPRPIACSIGIGNGISNGLGDEQTQSRGLRIELTPSPERACVLMIYPSDRIPPAPQQFSDLKRLDSYAHSTRELIQALPSLAKTNSKNGSAKVRKAFRGGAQKLPDVQRPTEPPTSTEPIPTPTRQLANVSDSLTDAAKLPNRALQSFHFDLDLNATCYRIANETRRVLGCGRVSVLTPRGRRFQVTAVSGVAVVDRRSNVVRALERLTQSAVVLSRPLVIPSIDPLPDPIQRPMDDYLDHSGAMSSILLPLSAVARPRNTDNPETDFDSALGLEPFRADREWVGVIVVEYFKGDCPDEVTSVMNSIAVEASLALTNAGEHHRVFGLRVWKTIGNGIAKLRSPLATAAVLLASVLLVAAMLIQVDHHVIATGRVEPTIRREVFAPVDGIVKTLHVADGQFVRQGDLLVTLENAELESQADALASEIQTASERLRSLAAIQLAETGRGLSGGSSSSVRGIMEQRQLTGELSNLRRQQVIVENELQKLSITAPMDGQIVAWQMDRQLRQRPVNRGNRLISIIDPAGPWSLNLNIPDDDAGPVIETNRAGDSTKVTFAVATLPSDTFAAELKSISTAARLDVNGNQIIDAEAMVIADPDPSGNHRNDFDRTLMRSGADVTAKIHCGKRTVLRSWFSDVIDFVYRNVLFYF